MPKTLDVYRDWLQIPEKTRPLNHYQLLRLKQFEDDAGKIREHYRKLNGHVRKFAAGEFNKALEVSKKSSLAHYRIAEVFYLQKNYQASANAYRESLNGDGEPRWTEVWSHLQLGKIFDVTGQRERAVNEYRQALQTNDNTQGALEESRRYMQKPFEREKGS